MKTVLRSLIVWLLLLALPVQGLAAARMLPSAPAPPAHAAPLVKPCHDMPAAHAAKAAPGEHQDKHKGKPPSACGDCCIVVALVPAPIVPPAFAPPSSAIPFHAGHLASVDPALPERPPRRLVA
jgi:hypothetical protein